MLTILKEVRSWKQLTKILFGYQDIDISKKSQKDSKQVQYAIIVFFLQLSSWWRVKQVDWLIVSPVLQLLIYF